MDGIKHSGRFAEMERLVNDYYEENGKLIQTTGEKADDGTWVKSANAKEVSFDADKKAKAKQTVYNQGAELSDVVTGTKAYTSLAESAQKKMSLSDDEMSTYLSTLTTNIGTVNSYENGTDTLGDDSNYTREKVIANIQSAYGTSGSTAVTAEVNKYAQIISDNKTAMTDSQKIMDDNQVLADIAAMENGDEKTKAIESFVSQVKTATTGLSSENAIFMNFLVTSVVSLAPSPIISGTPHVLIEASFKVSICDV